MCVAADDVEREDSAIADDVSQGCFRRSNTSHALECEGWEGRGCRTTWPGAGDVCAAAAEAPGAKSKLQKHSM